MAPKQPGLPLEFSLEDVVGVDPPAPATSDLEFSIDDVVDVVQPSAPRERMYVEGSPEIGPLPNIQSPFLARPEPYAPPQIAAAPTPTPSRAAIPVPPVGSPWLDRGEPYRPPQAPVEPTLPAMAPVPSHAAAQPPMAPPALAPSHQRPEPPRSILEPQGPTLAGQFVRHAWGGLVSGPGASIGRLLADAGVISEEGAKRLADMHADVTESKASGHILDDPKGTLGNPYWWAEAGGQVGGSVLGLYAASITGGPRLALMGEAALEGTGAYDQARSSGASPEQAGEAAAAVVLANLPWIALTNRPLFDAPTTSRIVNAAVRILSEGGQEAGQEIIQDTSAKVTYDPSRPMVGKGTFDAAVIGGLVGPLAGAAIDKVTSIGAPAAPNAPAPAQPQAAAPSAPEASVEFSVEDVADVQPSPTTAAVEAARAEVNLEPTDAQKEAGNYKKGHVRMHGLDITVENPVGSERSGTGADGKPWSVTMPGDYGYVKRTEGADGDQVDVYIGPDHGSQQVFVVDQVDLKTGKFDEHKAILGTSSEADALKLYAAGFSDGKGGDRVGGVTPMSIEEFGAWAREGDTSKPLAAEDRPADTKKASPTDFSAPVSSRLPVRELSDDEIRREWADGAVRLNTKTLPDYDERLARHRQVTAEMGRRAREGSAAPEQAESKPTTYESWDTEDIIGEIETADARGRAQMLEELARRGLTPEQVRGDEPIGPKSVGSGQTPAAAAQSKPAVKPKGTPASKEGPWASVGRNAAGQELFEDPRGVRSVIEDGVRITEPVTLRPTRAGMQFAVDRTGDRAKQWEVASDVTAEPSPAPATTPAQAYPAAEEKALKTIRKWANWDSGDDARGSGRVNYEREDKAAEKLAELVKRVVTDGPGRFVGTITPNLRVVAWGTSGSLDDARLEFKDGADQWQIVTTIDADEAMAVAGAMELPQEEPAKPESAAKKTAAEMTDEELAAEILADIEAESKPSSVSGTPSSASEPDAPTPPVKADEPTFKVGDAPAAPAAKVTYNEEKHSVEVGFARKPDAKVLDSLKSAGFRWAKGNKVWYRKISAKGEGVVEPALEHARKLVGGADSISAVKEFVRGKQEPAKNVQKSDGVVAPEGYAVFEASKTTAHARRLFNLPAYKAVAQRVSPWSSEAGYGDTPEAAQRDALRRVGAPTGAGKASDAVSMSRADTIDAILKAARKPAPNVVEAFEVLGANGKWYRAGVSSMPIGVSRAVPEQKRSIGWVILTEQGTTVGRLGESREQVLAFSKANADRDEADFRSRLEESPNSRVAEQAAYWLKQPVTITDVEPWKKTGEQNADSEAGQRSEATGEAGGTASRRIEASTPPSRRESDAQRAARKRAHYDEVFGVVLERAQAVDPQVDPAALRAEFDARIGLLDELTEDYEQSGRNPRALLEAIAKAGGISIASEGADGMAGELRWVKESPASGPFGAYAGVRGVFQKRQMGGNGTTQFGHSLDDMLRFLEGNREFSHITTVNDLVAALQDIARITDADRGGTFPGTRELAKLAGMVPDSQWWGPQASLDALEMDSAEPDDADVSFDPTTFDTLDTGEAQGRLPEAGAVRDTDTQTPEFEAPFSLDGGADTTRKGSQRSIFDAPAVEESSSATDTPEFKKWFGRSVAEKNGRPEVLYHGTDEVFSEFERSEDIGFHFGPKATAEARLDQGKFNPRILMPVYLSVQRPLVLNDLHTWSPKNVLAALVDHFVITKAQADTIDVVDRETVRDLLARRGYDGIVYRNDTEGGGESYIVFRSEQVKSAERNSGAFDRTNPNIYDEAKAVGTDAPVTLEVRSLQTGKTESVTLPPATGKTDQRAEAKTVSDADIDAAQERTKVTRERLEQLREEFRSNQQWSVRNALEAAARDHESAMRAESDLMFEQLKQGAAAPKPSPRAEVSAKRADIIAKIKANLRNNINTGVDPQNVVLMVQLVRTYIDEGVIVAADAYRQFSADFGDGAEKLTRHFELAWKKLRGEVVAVADFAKAAAQADTTAGESNEVRTRPDTGAEPGAGKPSPDRAGRAGALGAVPPADVRGPEAAGTGRAADGRPKGVSADGVPNRADDGAEPATAEGDGRSTVPRDTLSPSGATHAPGLKPADYALTDERIKAIIGRGTMTRARDNLAAIHLVKELWREGRYVTHDEQELLAKYVGWGAGDLAAFLAENPAPGWKATEKAIWQELRDVLTPQERAALTNSSTNAHFTYDLYRPIWDVLEKAGFTGGRVLEPAVGVGHAFGFMDPTVRANSTLSAVELEPITATIAQALYPSARVQAVGYEQARIARDTQDLVISNVPFGKFGVVDPSMTGERSAFTRRIHNYFFGKALEQVRPGGLIVFVTSRYTMDAGEHQGVRRLLAKGAHFLGAVRLPNTAFNKSAKTEVVTDLIVLQKPLEGETPRNGEAFITSARHEGLSTSTKQWVRGEQKTVESNVYTSTWYQTHPEFILGTESREGSMRTGNEYTVTATSDDIQGDIRRALAKILPEGSYAPATTTGAEETPTHVAEGYFKPGELSVTKDGRVERVDQAGNFADVTPMRGDTVDTAAVKRIGKMIAIRNALRETLTAMRDPEATDTSVKKAQKNLTRAYENFVKEYGQLNSPLNKRVFRLDPEVTNLMALETLKADARRVQTKRGTILRVSYEVVGKADIFTKRLDVAREIEHAATPADALMASLGVKTRIDWPYMARLSGRTAEDLQTALAADGRVYQAPDGAWVLAEDYLSGDVRAKLADAKAAAATEPERYAPNVAALERVQPAPKTFADIKITLGSPYVPVDVVDRFIRDEVGGSLSDSDVHVGLDATTTYVRWDLRFGRNADLAGRQHPLAVRYGSKNEEGVGNKAYSFTDLVADALNLNTPTLGEMVGSGKEKVFVKDEVGTRAARANVEEVRERWFSWLLARPAVQERLAAIYNERFNGSVNRTYDGAHLANYSDWNPDTQTGTRTAALPGLALKFPLFPHQLRAVWRILTSGNTLLAHEVGAGKTFEMIVAAMEMRRTGRARKPMITVPTFLLQSWRQDVLKSYPNARVLAFDEKDLAADKRQEAMARIAFGDWDIVLVPHSSFELLKVSDKRMADTLQEMVDELMDAEQQARASRGDDDESVKKLAAARRRLQDKVKKKLDKSSKGADNALTWDQLGVDALFVDEAHAFKNLYFATKISGLRGLSASESDRSLDMFIKIKEINEQSNYRNLVLATATPVMNSMAEIFTMQRYLQPQELRAQGLESFDNWYAVFAEARNGTEQAPDGTYQEVMRLRKFRNLDLLYRTVAQVMDYVGWKDMPYLKLPTVRDGVQIVQTDPHPIYPTLQQWFAVRLANLRDNPPKYNHHTGVYTAPARPHPLDPEKKTGKLDNILTVMNDAKLAAIDPRLLLPNDVTDWAGSRLQAAAKNMMAVYRREKIRKGVQLVFLDVGTPKDLTPLEFLGTTAVEDTTDGGALGTEDEITADDEFYPATEEGEFNLYEALKAELVKRGVPSREIAFIHQAAKPAERLALFEAAREGEVRFLFASTDKGGVGMNIQTRLAAEHHFDAPRMGRPGDIKQRDGRIIRQGNQYDEIDIFRYVTKGTTDEWLYGMLGGKSTMIGEFMVGNATEFEDEDPSTMSIEEAQVRATGNPLGIELVKLKASLERLRAQAIAEETTRAKMQADLATNIPRVERLTEERNGLREWIHENHEPIKGDAFQMYVGGTSFTERAEANKALRAAATKVFNDQAWQPVEIGALRGMPIMAKHEAGWRGRRVTLELRTKTGIGDIEITTLDAPEGIATEVGIGRNIVASASERYNSLPARLELLTSEIKMLDEQIERAEAIVAKPAEYVTRFNDATRRISELETRLKEESAAKMAATDAQVKEAKRATAERSKPDSSNSGMPVSSPNPADAVDREIPIAASAASGRARSEHRPSAIEAKLLKAIGGIPRRIGRLPSSWMRGVFKGGPNTIRLRVANDLRALFHEAGHAFDITILKIDRADKRWNQELMDLGAATSKPSYSNGQVRMEGAAEFFHLYLLSPATAERLAPAYFAEFEARLAEHPELRDALHDVREDIQGYKGLSEADRGRMMIDRSSTPGVVAQTLSDPKRAVRKMAIETIEDLQALKEATTRMRDGGPVSMIDDGYVLGRVARGAAGKAEAFLEHGVRGWGGKLIAPGLAEALAPVKGHLEAFEDYMVALRALELIGRGKLAGMTASHARAILEEAKSRDDFKQFEKARDAVYEFQSATLEYARQYGAFSMKQIKQIEALNQNYVPMQRVMDAAEDGIRGVAKRLANRVSPVKALSVRGSGRDVIAPTESIIRNTFAIVDMVEKNRAMQALVRQAGKAQGSGKWIERIPTPKVATTFNLASLTKDIAAALDEAGVEDVPDNLDEALDELVTIFTPASFAKGDDQIVTVIVGGERQFWQVNDTDLYEAIAAIGPRDVGRVMQWMETPVKVLRAGATMTLQFMARNPGRDTIVAWLQSNHGFIPIYDTIRGVISQVRGDEDAQLFYSRGIQQAAMQAQDRNSRQRLVERLGKGSSARLRSIAANPLDILRGLGEFMETSTRMGEFKLVLDSGGERRGALERIGQRNAERPTVTEETLVRATIAARDVTTDFSRGGHLAKEINRFEAFFNARVQGYVRMAETARENPVGLGLKLGTLAALSAAIWFMNEDDDEYNELEEWEKHSYWHLKLQGTNRWLRIPKPFEFGYVPDVVEAGLEFAKKGSAERFRTMRQNLVGDDPLQLIVNLLPTGILPLAEVWANYDAFRDTHIVRPWDIDRIPTDQQYTDWTSETAKLLGQVIPVAPAMLDHIIYGYTAGLGRSAVDTIDSGLRMTGQAPTKGIPADASQRWPAVGAYLRDRSFGGSSRSIQDVYDLAQAIQTVENGAKNDREAGRPDAAAARIAAGREDLPWDRRAAILSGQKQLKEMGPRIRAIYAAPPSDMTPAEKRERLDRLYEQMVAVSRRALGRPPLARAGGQ